MAGRPYEFLKTEHLRKSLLVVARKRLAVVCRPLPHRVKCLHALIAHSLSAGPGVNPLGDEALAELPEWWKHMPCE